MQSTFPNQLSDINITPDSTTSTSTETVVRRKRVTRRRHRKHSVLTKKQCYSISPPNSDDDPQMSTPDDPVIHSPPPLNSNQAYNQVGIKLEDNAGRTCGSPDDSIMDHGEDSKRHQKTCRVCGDHATGYNFNVITCESCKAFFRRNALRPKEFKCPYSEDCEINSVSRRFCQKCRLRKCFKVGMKKEWILNEEQLRRRKNSRLNNQSSSKRNQQNMVSQSSSQSNPISSHPSVSVFQQQQQQQSQRTLSTNPIDTHLQHVSSRPNIMQPLISPPVGQPYPLTSPVGSASSESPPSRNLALIYNGERSPESYDPNMMSQRTLSLQAQQPKIDANGKVVLSAEEYKQLLAKIPQNQTTISEGEPHTKRTAYMRTTGNQSPPYAQPMAEMSISRNSSTSGDIYNSNASTAQQPYFDIASFGMGMATATGGGDAAEEMYRKMNFFCDTIIQSALDSPENVTQGTVPMPPLPKSDTLSAAELKSLDIVREAFVGMDDPMEQGRQMQSCLKLNKSPADIMNIMDVPMRRFVKVAKGVPAFRNISQEGKFSMLKGGMIEMLTIHGVCRYDETTNSFKTPTIRGVDVSVNVDDMFDKLNANAQAQKQKCLEFFRFFDDEIKKNELAVNLVMLIVLFTVRQDPPMNENDVIIVNEQHEHFLMLLGRYLESLYGDGAKRIFSRVPKALSMLNDIARNAGMLFMGTVRNGETEELPKEFFRIE